MDSTPIKALNRLFKEYWPQNVEIPEIHVSDLVIEKQQWDIDKLQKIKRKDKTTTSEKVKNSKCPVVVLVWKGENYLIDGRRRINTWIADNDSELHYVILLTHKNT